MVIAATAPIIAASLIRLAGSSDSTSTSVVRASRKPIGTKTIAASSSSEPAFDR